MCTYIHVAYFLKEKSKLYVAGLEPHVQYCRRFQLFLGVEGSHSREEETEDRVTTQEKEKKELALRSVEKESTLGRYHDIR